MTSTTREVSNYCDFWSWSMKRFLPYQSIVQLLQSSQDQINNYLRPSTAGNIGNKLLSHNLRVSCFWILKKLYTKFLITGNPKDISSDPFRKSLVVLQNENYPVNQSTYFQPVNLQVFFIYFYRAKFSLFNHVKQNLGPLKSSCIDSWLVFPNKHLIPVVLFQLLVFFSYSASGWAIFSLVILSKLLVFLLLSLSRLRGFSPAHLILAHGFPLQFLFLDWEVFHPKFSYLEFLYPWFFSSVSYLVRRFLIWVARSSNTLRSVEFAFKKKVNYNSMPQLALHLLSDCVQLSII